MWTDKNQKRTFMAPLAIILIAASSHGYAQSIDCRSCHTPTTTSGTKNSSQSYLRSPGGHPTGRVFHLNSPAGVKYPTGLYTAQTIILPNGRSTEVTIFDTNGNEQSDSDDAQLSEAIDDVTREFISGNGDISVNCPSCHTVYGNGPAPSNAAR